MGPLIAPPRYSSDFATSFTAALENKVDSVGNITALPLISERSREDVRAEGVAGGSFLMCVFSRAEMTTLSTFTVPRLPG